MTNSPAHFVEPHTLWTTVDFCHRQLGYCTHHKQHCWDVGYIPSICSNLLFNSSDSAGVNFSANTYMFVIKWYCAGSSVLYIKQIRHCFCTAFPRTQLRVKQPIERCGFLLYGFHFDGISVGGAHLFYCSAMINITTHDNHPVLLLLLCLHKT